MHRPIHMPVHNIAFRGVEDVETCRKRVKYGDIREPDTVDKSVYSVDNRGHLTV